jgi:hypothetical protein
MLNENVKDIKRYRMIMELLKSIGIKDNFDIYYKYINNHIEYEKKSGIENDIDEMSTIPDSLFTLSEIKNLSKVHIVNSDDKKLKDYELTIHYTEDDFTNIIMKNTRIIINAISEQLNEVINNGKEIYIYLLIKSIEREYNKLTIKSKMYTK